MTSQYQKHMDYITILKVTYIKTACASTIQNVNNSNISFHSESTWSIHLTSFQQCSTHFLLYLHGIPRLPRTQTHDSELDSIFYKQWREVAHSAHGRTWEKIFKTCTFEEMKNWGKDKWGGKVLLF